MRSYLPIPAPRITDEMLAAETRFFAARRGLEDAAQRAGFEILSIVGNEVTYTPKGEGATKR